MIIIGRNQNTLDEIDPEVVAARGIPVVRRLSGRGAVYHDLGNLNCSVLTPAAPERFNRYEAFLGPCSTCCVDAELVAALERQLVGGPYDREANGAAPAGVDVVG